MPLQACNDCRTTRLCPLHAAAPKLLEALEQAVEHCDNFVIWLKDARKAIAEAKGE